MKDAEKHIHALAEFVIDVSGEWKLLSNSLCAAFSFYLGHSDTNITHSSTARLHVIPRLSAAGSLLRDQVRHMLAVPVHGPFVVC